MACHYMGPKIFKKILRHKLIAAIILIITMTAGYFSYNKLSQNENPVQYAAAAVEKGTIIVSVSGSGQTAVSDQMDINPKVSGDIVYVGAKNGQEIKLVPGQIWLEIIEPEQKISWQ